MPAPKNTVKAALAEGRIQFGLWLASTSPIVAEIASRAGFDWCLVDGEHAPNDVPVILAQLQAMAGGSPVVVRVPVGDTRIVKQMLDMGVQTILVPMVNTAEEARDMVRAVRYPPAGRRGVGAAMARATSYGTDPDYLKTADAEICLIVQVETQEAIDNLAEIAAVDGVDGVFLGPSDLSASMGHLGDPGHADVIEVIRAASETIRAAGKAVGMITFDEARIAAMKDVGGTFIAVGGDLSLLGQAARSRAAEARRILTE